MIIYVWKVLEGLVPNINNNIHANNNPRLGRKCITVSHTNKYKDSQVTGIGISLFNLIPKSIRELTNVSVEVFKKALDKYLLKLPDEPHLPGLNQRRSRTNSLIDVVPTWNVDRGRAFNCPS